MVPVSCAVHKLGRDESHTFKLYLACDCFVRLVKGRLYIRVQSFCPDIDWPVRCIAIAMPREWDRPMVGVS